MLAGLCHYESIIDGTLDLADLDVLNELIDVRAVNSRREQQAVERPATSDYVTPPRSR